MRSPGLASTAHCPSASMTILPGISSTGVADEIFFCGTASEVTPVRSVDHWQVGSGKRGPITGRVQERFLAIVKGEHPDRHGWLTPATRSAGGAKPKRAGVGA